MRSGLLAALLGGIAGLALDLGRVPEFEARTLIQIDPRKKAITSADGAMAGLRSDAETADSEAAVIRSPAVLTRIPAALAGRGADASTLPGLAAHVLARLGGEGAAAPAAAPHERLAEIVTAARVRNTLLVEIRARLPDAERAAMLANAVAEAYIADQIDQRTEASRTTARALEAQVASLKAKVLDAEHRRETFKAENGARIDGIGATERHIARLSGELDGLDAASRERTQRSGDIARLRQESDPTAAAALGASLSGETRGLLDHWIAAERRARDLAARAAQSSEHRRATSDAATARAALLSELDLVAMAMAGESEATATRARDLAAERAGLIERLRESREAALGLTALERETKAARQMFEALLGRMSEPSSWRGLQLPDARIVAPATAPQRPVSPPFGTTTALAAIAAGLAGVGLGWLAGGGRRRTLAQPVVRPMVRPVVHSGTGAAEPIAARERRAAAAVACGTPIMRARLAWAPGPCGGAAVQTHGAGPLGTALARFSQHLAEARRPGAPLVVLVSSGTGDAATSPVARDLAHAFAAEGARAVLVDADLRNGHLTRMLTPAQPFGLRDALALGFPVARCLLRDAASGLHLLPAIGSSPARAEAGTLLAGPQLAAAFAYLAAHFDVIVVDAPPVLVGPEAGLLARLADRILIVAPETGWREPTEAHIQERLGPHLARTLALVLEPGAGVVPGGAMPAVTSERPRAPAPAASTASDTGRAPVRAA